MLRYASPTPAVCAVPAPVVEYISPTPAGSYAEPAPVVEYISTVPAVYAAPGPLVEYVSPPPAVSIAEPAPTVYAAHDTVVEYISPATAISIAAPTPVQYAAPVKHAAPEHCAMDSSADTQPSFAPTAPCLRCCERGGLQVLNFMSQLCGRLGNDMSLLQGDFDGTCDQRSTHDDCEWSRFQQGWHFKCTSATSAGYSSFV